MLIHSHLPYDQSTSHARVPAGGINLIASIDSAGKAQVTASFFGSTKALNGENAIPSAETSTHNHSNQQYSVTAVTTSAGSVAERYAYSAYGEPTICDASGSVIASSAINNRYSYTGREWDNTVGLYHFRARWMSPKTGRFLGRDPIGYKGSPWDLYEFLDGSPVLKLDPKGLRCCLLTWDSGNDSNGSHSALKCDNGYYSKYRYHNNDEASDRIIPTHSEICMDCLDEAAIARKWQEIKDWTFGPYQNCSFFTWTLIEAGMIPPEKGCKGSCPCGTTKNCFNVCTAGTGLFYYPKGTETYMKCMARTKCDPWSLRCDVINRNGSL
jgi:RHS repeat-associated protein